MRVVENTLEVGTDRWDDSGDYPNSLAQRALSSLVYPVLDGEVYIQLEPSELIEFHECPAEFADAHEDFLSGIELPCGVNRVVNWELSVEGGTLIAQAQDIDFSTDPYEVGEEN